MTDQAGKPTITLYNADCTINRWDGLFCAVNPVVDDSIRQLCKRPYQNHPIGCPNYNKRITCPPRCPLLKDIYHLDRPFFIKVVAFDLATHRLKMQQKHHYWSKRQLECCLYWQGGVNSRLRKATESACFHTCLKPTFCPEAMGVNVTATLKQIGLELEWPPINWVYKVALMGTPLSDD